jgi:hypothetical protein
LQDQFDVPGLLFEVFLPRVIGEFISTKSAQYSHHK